MKRRLQKILAAGLCICSILISGLPSSDVYAEGTKNSGEQGHFETLQPIGVDENGNVTVVESESDGVVQESEIIAYAESDIKIVNFRSTSSGTPVTDITTYTEYGTGADGYTYGAAGADAAYLGTENGKVKFMQAGVIGLVDSSKVQIVRMSSVKSYSHYYADGSNLYHRISMDLNSSGYGGNVYVGPQQSYMKSGQVYYSYDGHYFYTNYETMLSDYRNNVRTNSINPKNPYYNYFQYLPLRGKSQYSATKLTSMINSNSRVSETSKMYNKGTAFVNNQNTYGPNALLMTGVAAIESAWGTSSICQSKNNLFGIGAVDISPGESAYTFSSPENCIKDYAETYLSKRYLRAGYTYYNGGFLGDKASGINVSWCSDPYWGEKVASIAWSLDNGNGKKDQYRYTIGIKDPLPSSHTRLNVRKEATTSSTVLYTTGLRSNYAFLIRGESGGFYNIQSDPVLNSGRTQIDSNTGVYNASSMYAYTSKDYVTIVSNGAMGGSEIPSAPGSGNIAYSTHVQTYGWKDWAVDGATAGTVGLEKRAEAISIQLPNQKYSGSVQYRAHVQSYGWLDWVSDGAVAGTVGQAKRMEALQVRLTGKMEQHYDVYYRVHVQTYGWLDWAKNGEIAGTTDAAKRLEAVQIVLVTKGGKAPGSVDKPYVQPLIQYQAHVQTYGWLDSMLGGGHGGTEGLAKQMEAIRIQLLNQKYPGEIQYRVHAQTYGWLDWVNGNGIAGTTGQAKRMEAIQIQLTGEMAQKYDAYYRVHVQSYGWLDWARNGEKAGTTGLAKRMECIQIVLMKKGAEAPGSMAKAYIGK